MHTDVIPQPSSARCYICNQAEDIEQVCHHCGRSICREHAVRFRWFRPVILNREFKDLGLDKKQKTPLPVHCKKCVRNFYAHWFFFIASSLCLLGSAILLFGLLLHYHIIDEMIFMIFNSYSLVEKFRPMTVITNGLWILLVGILFYALHFGYWFIHFRKHRPPFSIVPNMDSIKIVETMHGSVHLDRHGMYTTAAPSLTGESTAPLQFVVRDRKRWKRYLARHRRIYQPTLPLQAGFVVFKEAENIKFGTSSDFINRQSNTFVIEGQVGGHPFLTNPALAHTHQWNAQLPYTIERFDQKKIPLPIQIFPALVQDDTQRSIGLVIQLSPQFTKLIKFEKAVIKEFTLLAPNALGKVLLTKPDAPIGPQINPNSLKVVWKDLEFDVAQNEAKNFSIQFGNQINQATTLSGCVQINFTGSFSGLKNVEFFYPWGQKYTKAQTDREAIVYVDFELSLESLRFQKPYPKAQLHRYQHILTHALIIELTTRLENSKFYVRRVIENPAHTNPANAYVVNRLWDLAGRYYEGVYPFDFHLVLTGEEVVNKPSESRITVDFNVQAVVTCDPLRTIVDLLYKRLVKIVEDTI